MRRGMVTEIVDVVGDQRGVAAGDDEGPTAHRSLLHAPQHIPRKTEMNGS
jgi:hypothetical protein